MAMAVRAGNSATANQATSPSPDYFAEPSKEVRWQDIEQVVSSNADGNKEPGWISGVVFMVFRSKQKSEAQLKTRDGNTMRQLKIDISSPDFHRFQFTIGQSLKISLRGSQIVGTKAGTSVPGYMNFHLVFNEGASIKFISGGKDVEDGTIVDSWQGTILFAGSRVSD